MTPHLCHARRLLGGALWLAAAWAAHLGAQPAPNASDVTGRVLTVTGPVAPEALGRTLMHEHILANFTIPNDEAERWKASGWTKPLGATDVRLYNAPVTLDILSALALGAMNRDNMLLADEAVQAREVAEYKKLGGGTIVDVTASDVGRQPESLRRIAQGSGLNIVAATGWYGRAWYPADMAERSIEQLADEMVREIAGGIGGTGVRAGIIGSIGITDPSNPLEDKVLRAAGRASRLTGAPLSVAVRGRDHARVLDALAAEGADVHRVILGHADFFAEDVAYLKPLLDRGASVEFDLIGRPPMVTRPWPIDSRVAKAIVDLVREGYADRVLMSQGVDAKAGLRAYGGTGYAFIEQSFVPFMKRQGLSDADVNAILVGNPRRLLAFAAPR
ncbi:MAG: hypothetical protein IT356_07140 [Gemmatimonadaceae bacterium]|nr:hypothetical protein [Gemmatimonadaceae bacterium]